MTLQELDRTFYELLRRETVAKGYLPNWRTTAGSGSVKQANFQAAKDALKLTGKTPIDIWGTSADVQRDTKAVNRIVVNRKSVIKGQRTNYGLERYVEDTSQPLPPSGVYPLKKVFAADTVIVTYEIRTVTDKIEYDRVMYEIVSNALGLARKDVKAVDSSWNFTGEVFPIDFQDMNDVSAVQDIIEQVYTFRVIEVAVTEDIVIQQNIPALIQIQAGLLVKNAEFDLDAVPQAPPSSVDLTITVGAMGGSPLDVDAQAFITAANITNNAQKMAINQLVLDLKAANIWAKMYALYPFVGGSATSHKFNLKNPLDSDLAFRLVFSGGWTHTATGALPNGINAFANTKFIPSIHGGGLNNASYSYYSRSNLAGGTGVELGAFTIAPNNDTTQLVIDYLGSSYAAINSTFATAGAAAPPTGFYSTSRVNPSNVVTYRNGAILFTTSLISSNPTPIEIILASRNDNGVPLLFSNREVAFAHIGQGLDATEQVFLYNAVQTFQTTLGRNV